ncbi:MAG: HEAT repeat domain-containing protein [Alphaproteobacteria bacterium]|nr:HEAT repeat domain-containing protein [Alphaproteobacteria bacterium]
MSVLLVLLAAALAASPALDDLAAALGPDAPPAEVRATRDAMARLPLDEQALATALTSSPQPLARAWAAHALGHWGGPLAVEALLSATGDPAPEVRVEVYDALAGLGDPRGLKALRQAAVRDPDPAARARAEAAALSAIAADPPAIEADLIVLSEDDAPAQVAAARRLADSGRWAATEPLLEACRVGPLEVRQAAVLAVGALDDHRAVPTLLALLEDARGPLRYHVIAALAHIADASTVPPLAALLGDADPTTRQLAARALGWIRTPEAIAALGVTPDDPDEAVRVEAVHALPPDAALLERFLADASPFVRAEAARALGGGPRSAALRPLLTDTDPLVRLVAAEGLAAGGVQDAAADLRRLRDSARDPGEQASYAAALRRLTGE